jgi:uncharacterized delta-60 repeat protein
VNEDAADTVIDLHTVFKDTETATTDLVYSLQANDNPDLVSATVNNTTDTLTLDYQTNQFGTSRMTVRATDAAGLYVEDTFVVTVDQVHDGDPGDLDTGFNPDANSAVVSTAVQPDGKIIIGGYFTSVSGTARNRLVRLNADGTLEPGFNPNVYSGNGGVSCTAVQADGKILIGGIFTGVSGAQRYYLARLNADGTLESGFSPNVNSTVLSTVMQADGRIIIGGLFGSVDGAGRGYIARLNANGTLDSVFNPLVCLRPG